MSMMLLDKIRGGAFAWIGNKATGAALIETGANPLSTIAQPSADQDPIFDHANGAKLAVTTIVTLITPPAGCKWIRVSADADAFIRTDGANAADDGGSIRIFANQPEIIPVTAGTAVKAIAVSGTANIRATPMKVRA